MEEYIEVCGIDVKDLPRARCLGCKTKWKVTPKNLQHYNGEFFVTCPICHDKGNFPANMVPEEFLPYIYDIREGRTPHNSLKGIMTIHE